MVIFEYAAAISCRAVLMASESANARDGPRPGRANNSWPSWDRMAKVVFSNCPERPMKMDLVNLASALLSYVARRMQTKFREAETTRSSDKKLLSMVCLLGHQMPGTPKHWGAADTNRIGRFVFRAAARPSASDPCQAILGVTGEWFVTLVVGLTVIIRAIMGRIVVIFN